jgi:hypothetical protein
LTAQRHQQPTPEQLRKSLPIYHSRYSIYHNSHQVNSSNIDPARYDTRDGGLSNTLQSLSS